MKVTNGKHTVETTEFLKNIWIRDGYEEVIEQEVIEQEVIEQEPIEEEMQEEQTEDEKEELTFAELRRVAKDKGINTHGMKKEDILEALGM